MARRSYPLSKVYGRLEPGPAVLLTTAHRGRANVMPLSWHTMLEFEPPLVRCMVSEADFSFTALRRRESLPADCQEADFRERQFQADDLLLDPEPVTGRQ